MRYKKELETAKTLARRAGDIMLEYFDGEHELEHKAEDDKNNASEVTIADKKINSMVIEELSEEFDYGVIGEEESNSEYGPGKKWICDPIDGTKAFTLGVPTCMFSLALVVDGVPILGVLYDPFLDKLYWGVKGQGSYCNDKKLSVSDDPIKGSYVEVTGDNKEIVERQTTINRLLKLGARLDMTYGAVYKCCIVANGKAVGFIERIVNPHDIAAAHVIIEEAGGKVTGYDGKELDYSRFFKGAVISNGVTHDDLLNCVKDSK